MGRPSVTRVRLTSGPAAAGTLHRRGLPARLAQLTALLLLGSLLAAPVQASVRVPATALPGSVSRASLTTISPAFAMPTALLNQTLLNLRAKYAIPGMQATIV